MSLIKKKSAPTYQQEISGTYGRFSTPAGYVNFLNTKAKLGKASVSPEHRLTGFLSPVREVLPHKDMDFNQLLQRDLDDHRVAVELVPYLLGSKSSPAFFPPIVAALLPFDGAIPAASFPDLEGPSLNEDGIANWNSESCGDSYRFDRLVDEDGQEHSLKVGRLCWNPEKSKLVVIDGQHRAMALLAVDRTINSKWTGTAEKYKSFYEPVVNRMLSSDGLYDYGFEGVEFPVTLVWFSEGGINHQKAARKIFVDLNKNARRPSDSRILLLSDDDLVSVFTRSTLNHFRGNGSEFPIYAVEYDNPESDQTVASKWSVVTNVSLISNCVKRVVCGPSKYYCDLDSRFGGKESAFEMAKVLRDSLDVSSVLEEVVVEDRIYKRSDISNLDFPPSKVDLLESQYSRGWGAAITEVYTRLLPFRAHADALEELRVGWSTSDSAATLAKDSIFEGVGVYWTLKDSESHWREINADRKDKGEGLLPKTDVIDAWAITQEKKTEFSAIRSKHYLGNAKKASDSDSAYQVFSTAACQLGLVLAMRAVAERASVSLDNVAQYARDFVSALNLALEVRRLVLAKDTSDTKSRFNLIGKLDTPHAVHFRYFWLELLLAPQASEVISAWIDQKTLAGMVSIARASYRRYLVDEAFKDQKRLNTDLSIDEAQLRLKAKEIVDEQLSLALKGWFGINKPVYQQWVGSIVNGGSAESKLIDEADGELEANSDPAAAELEDAIEKIMK
ncbi:DNA sulfur modification protein DndB [Pseudomonas aeruginosa]|uniref:DNA sulfur modification protein DndB n=1 Tax=Pseudomonas aeruginosa TaxID=287 RepID=UPI001D192598|nr:DNA sulfur modification protein DndB [Pseudomonas aeruginosa]MCC4281563.1 hypothetical protein [Pseudomonas aeruginosa]MEC4070373.1 DNA sulfur modification protein DndB [Pseudomonas aeruginosa]HBO2700915.1 hypothetical protein [Pseudomonas aeruginosa]HEP9710523.1 hypothetical protein [Pseudomonas aeruginosa]